MTWRARARRIAANAAPVVGGFVIGWAGWSLADRRELVSPEFKYWLHDAQRSALQTAARRVPALQRWVPVPSEEAGSSAVAFNEILGSCRIAEQCDWLMDHLSEPIPYFYIHDLFAAWATLHEGDPPENRGPEDLHREDVIGGVWVKAQSGVLPLTTALRCLAVLSRNRRSALALEQLQQGTAECPVTNGDTFAAALVQAAAHCLAQSEHADNLFELERIAHCPRATLEVLSNMYQARAEAEDTVLARVLRAVRLKRPMSPWESVLGHDWHRKEEKVNALRALVSACRTPGDVLTDPDAASRTKRREVGMDPDRLALLREDVLQRPSVKELVTQLDSVSSTPVAPTKPSP